MVDEFGGTEGLVTLHDALREIVVDIDADGVPEASPVRRLGQNLYEVDGSFPLDELESLTGVSVDDEEHETVAGFLMAQSDKILEVGDEIRHEGIRYTVKSVEGKRVARLQVNIANRNASAQGEAVQ